MEEKGKGKYLSREGDGPCLPQPVEKLVARTEEAAQWTKEEENARHGSEGQLEADVEEHRGIDQQQEQGGKAKDVPMVFAGEGHLTDDEQRHHQRRAAKRNREAYQKGEAPNEHNAQTAKHVADARKQDMQQAEVEDAKQDAQMQARKGKDVRGSGESVELDDLGRQSLTMAEQHGGDEGFGGRRKLGGMELSQ